MTDKIGEFDLIRRYFAPLSKGEKGAFNLTDDAAVLGAPSGEKIVVTTDSLIEGIHFFNDDPADLVAAKLLAVNLSDLASMAATPAYYTLSLALPIKWEESKRNNWLEKFSNGLSEYQKKFKVTLVGGDTVAISGPLVLTITAFGLVRENAALRRNGAAVGDTIWVTGTIGDSALGLLALQNQLDEIDADSSVFLVDRYRRPQPRIAIGQRLHGNASAAIDVSDGLAADLAHMCRASGVGAEIDIAKIPISAAARTLTTASPELIEIAITGGDDYELLFTTDPGSSPAIESIEKVTHCTITEIGRIIEDPAIRFLDDNGENLALSNAGYNHFNIVYH